MKWDNMPKEFWHVYSYLAVQWYMTEYGQVHRSDRWYHPAMQFLEQFAETAEVR